MDEDVTKLTDEELKERIETPTEEVAPEEPESPDETPTEEEPEQPEEVTEEEPEEQPEEVEQEAEEPEEEEAKPPSRREQLRIQQLLEKMKQTQQPTQAPQQPGVNYRDMIEAEEPVYEQLDQASQQFGQAQYNAGLEQAKSIQFHTRLEIDAPKVESKYPQLNPNDKEHFKPALANAVNTWYLQTTGYQAGDDARGIPDSVSNPNIRYSEFVEGIMELGSVIGSEKSQQTAKAVAKQATQTGLRPDGSQAKRLNLNKAPEDMTVEELKAAIAQSLPRR